MNRMLTEMSWPLFCEWVAYAAEEPFGEERADARSAQITAMIANVNRDPKRNPRAYSIKDFMLVPDKAAKPRSSMKDPASYADLKRMMRLMAEAS